MGKRKLVSSFHVEFLRTLSDSVSYIDKVLSVYYFFFRLTFCLIFFKVHLKPNMQGLIGAQFSHSLGSELKLNVL